MYKKYPISFADYDNYEIGIYLGEKEYFIGARDEILLDIAYCLEINQFKNDLFYRFEKIEEK